MHAPRPVLGELRDLTECLACSCFLEIALPQAVADPVDVATAAACRTPARARAGIACRRGECIPTASSRPGGRARSDACETDSRCEDASVTTQVLTCARAGDDDAFRELTDPYGRELQVHIYR